MRLVTLVFAIVYQSFDAGILERAPLVLLGTPAVLGTLPLIDASRLFDLDLLLFGVQSLLSLELGLASR